MGTLQQKRDKGEYMYGRDRFRKARLFTREVKIFVSFFTSPLPFDLNTCLVMCFGYRYWTLGKRHMLNEVSLLTRVGSLALLQ